MRRAAFFISVVFLIGMRCAADEETRLFLPIGGSISTAAGRYESTLALENRADSQNVVTITFHGLGRNVRLQKQLSLAPGVARETTVAALFGVEEMLGAIELRSEHDLSAKAIVSLAAPGGAARAVATFPSLQRKHALSVGRTADFSNVGPRFNLHVMESAGSDAELLLELRDASNRIVAEQKHFVAANTFLILDLAEMFKGSASSNQLRCRVFSGHGRLLITSAQTNPGQSEVHVAVAMPSRRKIPHAEWIAYALIALLIVAGVARERM